MNEKITIKKLPDWIYALISALGFTGLVYLHLIQTPIMARREWIFTLAVFILFYCVSFVIFRFYLSSRIKNSTQNDIKVIFSITFLTSLFLMTIPGFSPAIFRLQPKHTLEITLQASPGDSPQGNVIEIQGFSTSLGDASYSQFESLIGSWERVDNTFIHEGDGPASLKWTGRTGSQAILFLNARPDGGWISVIWDGVEEKVNLNSESAMQVQSSRQFPSPIYPQFLNLLFFWISISFLCLLMLSLIQKFASPLPEFTNNKTWFWYALPMILVWFIFLLAVWPGMMTPDSISQWSQLLSLQFNDAHPVFHTLLLWLITRIWFSPAAIAIFQIIFLSLTAAWGIGTLRGLGLPNWAAWLLAVLFAFNPINGDMVNTIWKDIPYSTALFLLSIIFLRIILSNGAWLSGKYHWLWLALTGLLIALFRHNGFPVSVGSLLFLAVIYKKWWKQVLGSLLLLLSLWVGIRGPVYTLLKVDQREDTKQDVFLHHIAAHIVTGGPLLPEEQRITGHFQSIGDWQYNCCTFVITRTQPGFEYNRAGELASEIQSLFFTLLKRDPWLDVKHMFCAGSIVWETQPRCGFAPLIPNKAGFWIISNDFGLKENGQLHGLMQFIVKVMNKFNTEPAYQIFLSPALFLYLGLFCVVVFAIKFRRISMLLFMLPAAIQSGVLLMVNFSATQFRYQYGVYLTGWLSIGLLIIVCIRKYSPKK